MPLTHKQNKQLYSILLSQMFALALILAIMQYFRMESSLMHIASGSIFFQMLLAIWKHKN